jgi:antitoxin component HigA of HigAB toxin-antitoxin module
MLYEISKEERVLFLSCLEELAAEAEAPESKAYSKHPDWVEFIKSFAEDTDVGGAWIEE